MANRRQFLQLAAGLVVLPFVPVKAAPPAIFTVGKIRTGRIYSLTIGGGPNLIKSASEVEALFGGGSELSGLLSEARVWDLPTGAGKSMIEEFLESLERTEKEVIE